MHTLIPAGTPAGTATMNRMVQAVIRWFPIPVALALIGIPAGALAASTIQPSASAILRVQSQTQDASTMSRIVETRVQELTSPTVFLGAAELVPGLNANDLRERTRVSVVSNSQVITITVTAPTVEAAMAEVDAVVTSSIDMDTTNRDSALRRLTDNVRSLMTSPEMKLEDDATERTRQGQLGVSLAASQAGVVTSENYLILIQSAEPAPKPVSVPVLALICALGGGLLGVGAALLLSGRGRVRSLDTLTRIHPHVSLVDPHELPDLLAIHGPRVETVILAGVRAPSDVLAGLRDQVQEILSGSAATAHVAVLPSQLNQTVVRRVVNDRATVLLVAADPKTLRMEWLDRWLEEIPDRAYLTHLSGTRR